MKALRPSWLFCAVLIMAAVGGSSPFVHARDTLFLADRKTRVGKIISVDAKSFRLEVSLSGSANGAPVFATVTIPREDVVQIEFGPEESRDRKLREATPASLGELAALWKQWEPFLGVPKSPAGRIGNIYGDLLLQTKTEAHAEAALALFSQIESVSWAEDARMSAKQGRLRAMIATGNAAAAVKDALEIAKITEDPAVLVEAKYLLAGAADQELRTLLAENPRWEEDIHIIPERHRLYNQALDEYLFPYLFFGSESEAAARGLWGATGVYELVGELDKARETSRDILRIYPKSAYAPQAQALLDKLPKGLREEDPEKEAREEDHPPPKKKTKS
ncbi:MAG: hypothetical protein WEB60_05885 [Terrimicrobiaceae bacterium]